jgi:hypothetical protein
VLIQKDDGRRNAGLFKALIAACPVSMNRLDYSSGLRLPRVEGIERPHEDPLPIMTRDCQII